jgi:hypothetical protein
VLEFLLFESVNISVNAETQLTIPTMNITPPAHPQIFKGKQKTETIIFDDSLHLDKAC